MTSYSLSYSYYFADGSVRDFRIFDRLDTTDNPRSTAKIHSAFAHLRNTYIHEAFLPTTPAEKFFSRYYGDGFNANAGTLRLDRRDQCELAQQFCFVDLAIINSDAIIGYVLGLLPKEKIRRVENRFVGNATFVGALIEVRQVFSD